MASTLPDSVASGNFWFEWMLTSSQPDEEEDDLELWKIDAILYIHPVGQYAWPIIS